MMFIFQLFYLHSTMAALISMENMIPRPNFVKIGVPDQNLMHTVTFAVRQNNLDYLRNQLSERSTPGSPMFQQWFSLDEVRSLTMNNEATNKVLEWLLQRGAKITWSSKYGEYIRASAPISVWESAMSTKFFTFHDSQSHPMGPRIVHRAEQYSLPEELAAHVHAVFGTCQSPPLTHRSSILQAQSRKKAQSSSVTPSFLSQYYSIPITQG
jgi:subtilase family serine protease